MVKMGVVGMGMGGGHGATFHKSDVAELTAICDCDADKLKWRLETYAKEIDAHPRGYLDFEEMLTTEQLDGVVIATPSGMHHEQALIAAKHGLPMLVEKPIDITIENVDKIERAVKKAGLLCGVNYGQRFVPANYTIKKAIDAGAFGKLLMVDVRLKWFRDQDYYDRGGWRGTWAMDGGGSLMNQGAHPMDLLTWFAGRPKKIRGDFAALNHRIETEDWAAGIVEFENGVRSCITTTTNVAPKNDRIIFDIHGTEGSAYVVGGQIVETNIEALQTLEQPPHPDPLIDFVYAIKEQRQPAIDVDQARRSVELILGIYESARQGRTITV